MQIVSIPISEAGSTTEIQAWFDANTDKTVVRMFNVGNYWYIFYTEA